MGTKIIGFGSMDDFNRVARAARTIEAGDRINDRTPRPQGIVGGDDLSVVGLWNGEASADCPAFGIMLHNGTHSTSSGLIINGKRPDTYGCQTNFLIANEDGVTHGKGGAAQGIGPWGPNRFIAAYDNSDGTPAAGDAWGPRSGTYLLKKNTGGFRIIDVYDSTNHYALVEAVSMDHFYGKNAGSQIAKGSTGTINIFTGTFGSETDSSVTMGSVLARFGAIAANAMVECWISKTNSGVNWFAVETDTCPA